MGFEVERFDHIVLNCADVEPTASWDVRVLPPRGMWGGNRLRAGDQGRRAGTDDLALLP